MKKIRFLTITVMTTLIVFGITSQIMMTNIASAQQGGEICNSAEVIGNTITTCSNGGGKTSDTGNGRGGGGHSETTICDPGGNCISDSRSGGFGEGPNEVGGHGTHGYPFIICTSGCSFGETVSGGSGTGDGSFDRPQR